MSWPHPGGRWAGSCRAETASQSWISNLWIIKESYEYDCTAFDMLTMFHGEMISIAPQWPQNYT